MKDIFATIGKISGLIFAALVIGFTSWMTLNLAGRLIPGNVILQFFTLVLFDIAAFVWFIQFITQAKGTVQWAIAGIGFGVGLIGTVIMTGGELILGQQLVMLDDPSKLGWALVATVILAALAHATLIYGFHFTEPANMNRIENAQQVAKAVGKAYKDTRSEIERNSDELTAQLRDSVMFEARQQIATATAAHIRGAGLLAQHANETARGGVVIPGQFSEQPAASMMIEDDAPEQPKSSNPITGIFDGFNERRNGKKVNKKSLDDKVNELAAMIAALTVRMEAQQTGGGSEPAATYNADTENHIPVNPTEQ